MDGTTPFLATSIEDMIIRTSKRYSEELGHASTPVTRFQRKELDRLKGIIERLLLIRKGLMFERQPGSSPPTVTNDDISARSIRKPGRRSGQRPELAV
jgi:hypothetical protein